MISIAWGQASLEKLVAFRKTRLRNCDIDQRVCNNTRFFGLFRFVGELSDVEDYAAVGRSFANQWRASFVKYKQLK
jgi:hypothetical protein